VDKFTVAALEATLQIYLEEGEAVLRIPTMKMLSAPVEELERKARALMDMVGPRPEGKLSLQVVREVSQAGGGALPAVEYLTAAVVLTYAGLKPEQIEERLRKGKTPILGRISQDRYLLDMRTVQEDELKEIAESVARLAAEL
jgi:L-seryl-tRNA(Ser) seleniumtransferase